MPTGARKFLPATMVTAVLAGVLFFAFHNLPWVFQLSNVGTWTSFFVVCVAELLPIPAGHARYRFRAVAQLPFLTVHGLFPLVCGLTAIFICIEAVDWFRLRTFKIHYPRILSAVAAPLATVVACRWMFPHIGPLPIVRDLPTIAVAIVVFFVIGGLSYFVPGPRTVVHPWRPLRGWLLVLGSIDALLASSAISQQLTDVVWSSWSYNLLVFAVIGVIALYTDSSIRRARMVALSEMVGKLGEKRDLSELVEELFGGLSRLVKADVATLWIMGADLQLRPNYSHAYTDAGELIVKEHRSKRPTVPTGLGLTGFAASSREVICVQSPNQKILFDWTANRQIRSSALATPIVVNDEVFGVLSLYTVHTLAAFGEREQELLQIVGAQLAAVVSNLWRFEQTRLQSELDELTGLYNFRYFDSALQRCVLESDQSKQPLALLVIDIDHFKQVNDRYGHLAGNQVLARLAQVIREMVRDRDIVARYGGEEFTVLLPGLSLQEGGAVAERIRKRVEDTVFEVEDLLQDVTVHASAHRKKPPRTSKLKLTLSVGVSCYPEGADSAMALIRHADRAMYIGSKQQGRNRVSAYGQ